MAKTFNHKSEERRESQFAFVSFRILNYSFRLQPQDAFRPSLIRDD